MISLYFLLVVDCFHTPVAEPTRCFSLVVSGIFTIIGIRAMTSNTTTITKFEVEKINGKSNFLLWKMRMMALLVKEGTHMALLGAEKKPSKMEDGE